MDSTYTFAAHPSSLLLQLLARSIARLGLPCMRGTLCVRGKGSMCVPGFKKQVQQREGEPCVNVDLVQFIYIVEVHLIDDGHYPSPVQDCPLVRLQGGPGST